MNSAWLDRIGRVDAADLLEIVRGHPHLRAVCCGHVHQERVTHDAQTLIVTTPSTGVQFGPETPALGVDPAPPGFRVLDLQPDGRVTTWVERVVQA